MHLSIYIERLACQLLGLAPSHHEITIPRSAQSAIQHHTENRDGHSTHMHAGLGVRQGVADPPIQQWALRELGAMTLCVNSFLEYFLYVGSKIMHRPRMTSACFKAVLATRSPVDGDIHLSHEIRCQYRVKRVSFGKSFAILAVPARLRLSRVSGARMSASTAVQEFGGYNASGPPDGIPLHEKQFHVTLRIDNVHLRWNIVEEIGIRHQNSSCGGLAPLEQIKPRRQSPRTDRTLLLVQIGSQRAVNSVALDLKLLDDA